MNSWNSYNYRTDVYRAMDNNLKSKIESIYNGGNDYKWSDDEFYSFCTSQENNNEKGFTGVPILALISLSVSVGLILSFVIYII